jgi:hypothetical protein
MRSALTMLRLSLNGLASRREQELSSAAPPPPRGGFPSTGGGSARRGRSPGNILEKIPRKVDRVTGDFIGLLTTRR